MTRTRLVVVALALTLYSIPSPAPDAAGSHGGIGEKNVLFAFLNLPRYLHLCLRNARCRMEEGEKALLRRLLEHLETTRPDPGRIRFRSETFSPGTFRRDGRAHGPVSSAKTNAPDDVIWINSDHLYEARGSLFSRPISLGTIVGLLIDEVAHHVDARFDDPDEHRRLDLVAAKMSLFLEARTLQLSYGAPLPEVTLTIVGQGDPEQTPPQLLFSDPIGVQDLTDEYTSLIRCPGAGETLVGNDLHNPHWHRTDSLGQDVAHIWVSVACRADHVNIYRRHLYVRRVSLYNFFSLWNLAARLLRPRPSLEIIDCDQSGPGEHCH